VTVTRDIVGPAPHTGVGRGLVRGAVNLFGKWRPARFGLRTRIMSMFVIGALLLSTFLAAVAYSFTRSSLLNQREQTSTEQAYRNARVAQREISTGNTNTNAIIDRLQQVGVAQAAINVDGTWASPSALIAAWATPTCCSRSMIALVLVLPEIGRAHV